MPRHGGGNGRPRRATFPNPDGATPGGSVPGASAPSSSAPSTSADDGSKRPRRHMLGHCSARPHTGKIPLALRIVRENTAARMTGTNATPEGYYHASDKQKEFKWKLGNEIFTGDQILPKIHRPVVKTNTIFAPD